MGRRLRGPGVVQAEQGNSWVVSVLAVVQQLMSSCLYLCPAKALTPIDTVGQVHPASLPGIGNE
jgi:hypothetical protein